MEKRSRDIQERIDREDKIVGTLLTGVATFGALFLLSWIIYEVIREHTWFSFALMTFTIVLAVTACYCFGLIVNWLKSQPWKKDSNGSHTN